MKWLPASLLVLTMFSFQTFSFAQCEPFFGKLVINEVVPANSNSGADPAGEFDDWVEIYNGSDEAINLEGYFLSDNHGNKTKYVFPNVMIEPQGILTIWCDDEIEQEGLHAPFRLSASGEEVGFYNPDTTSLDYVRYGDTANDIAVGRFPNGAGPFRSLIPTFNQLNVNTVLPSLVINEYQAENLTTADDQWGEFADWVELYNGSSQDINLEGYFLSDKIGDPTQYVFPDTIMPANSYLIIWCDQGLFEPGLHTFFKLGASGDDILLSNADTLTIDYVRFDVQIPDDTEGRFPNGTGPIECMAPTYSMSNGGVMSLFDNQVPESFEIWPNPSKGQISITNESNNLESLTVYNSQGQLILQDQIAPGLVQLDFSEFRPGLYILNIANRSSKLILR